MSTKKPKDTKGMHKFLKKGWQTGNWNPDHQVIPEKAPKKFLTNSKQLSKSARKLMPSTVKTSFWMKSTLEAKSTWKTRRKTNDSSICWELRALKVPKNCLRKSENLTELTCSGNSQIESLKWE